MCVCVREVEVVCVAVCNLECKGLRDCERERVCVCVREVEVVCVAVCN